MKPPDILHRFASCAANGNCKREHCELWDQYSHTCTLKAILFELRYQTRELKDRRQYLKRKTVEEIFEDRNEKIYCKQCGVPTGGVRCWACDLDP